MAYGDCYQQFYLANPSWSLEGTDGAPVFEAWSERLCTEEVGGRAECEVVEFQQLLEHAAQRLSVTYSIPGTLESQLLLFGPLPLDELAECEGGSVPRMGLEPAGTRGLDANGNVLWTVTSSDVMEAAPGDRVTIRAAN